MKKFIAYTLAETVLALVVIGVLAVATIKIMSSENVNEKATAAKVSKVFSELQKAASAIITSDTDQCPAGAFLTKMKDPSKNALDENAYTYEYAILNSSGGLAATADVVALFSKHLEFDEEDLSFCSYTSYCSNNNIKGGKVMGDTYIGFEVFGNTALQTCPLDYFIPVIPPSKDESGKTKYFEPTPTKTARQAGKCWGKVYVFVKNKKPENTLGKDIFVWGLGESGLVY